MENKTYFQGDKYIVFEGDKNTIKVLKFLWQFTSSYEDKPALNCLHVAKPVIEAADVFTLAIATFKPKGQSLSIFDIVADGLYKLLLTGSGMIVLERQEMEVEYPKVDSIMNGTKYLAEIDRPGEYKYEFCIQTQYLARLAMLRKYGEYHPNIRFWSGDSNAPVYFENVAPVETMYGYAMITGAIMPMHREESGIKRVK